MNSALSTPPAIAAGTLGSTPQPVLSAAGGLLLRPWEDTDATVFFAAYRDPEIQHWHTRQPASEAQVREWFERHPDRNLAVAGKVIKGMELLAAYPRGGEPMGFYDKPEQPVPIV